MLMAGDVGAVAVLPVFGSVRRPPIRREALVSAVIAAVERVNLVPRTCEVVPLLLAMVVRVLEVLVGAVVGVAMPFVVQRV